MKTSLEKLLEHIPLSQLREAAETLSQRYRHGEKPYLTEEYHYAAYLAVRFPATFQAISQTFQQVNPETIHSFLDLGAGPGTGFLAAQTYFEGLTHATLIETDPHFISLGKQLTGPLATWKRATLPCTLPPHDLVLLSYSLNEMAEPEKVVKAAWAATQQFLVIIEPGTPAGYAQLMATRTFLLSQGAFMVAPCPNALDCPMQKPNWCHFPARVERNRLHRYLKQGTLGFEDEKYSYLIVSKTVQPLPKNRVVAPVTFKKNQVILPLCTEGQLSTITVTQKTKELYKRCRKLSWGDEL